MTVDWEGLKALRVKANAIGATIPEVDRYTLALISEFPAILAQHERDQRVIEAAERLAITVIHGPADEIDMALAEYDKAKQ